MRIRTKSFAGTGLVLAAALAVAAAPVMAATGTFTARTTPVQSADAQNTYPDLAVFGRATLTLKGVNLTAHITASGLSPNLPHLVHIHGVVEARNECPPNSVADDRVDDGLIDTIEGQPAYGPILVTFSTSGSTSASAGLNIGTASVADSDGRINYMRSFRIPSRVAKDLGNLHIVIHGADLGGAAGYDGVDGSLGAGIPLEAEIPVSCGAIN